MKIGLIYKIISPSIDKFYIGSTEKTLEERLIKHEEQYEFWINSEFKTEYCTSFEIIKYGDYEIQVIEEYPYLLKRDLFKKEGYYQIVNYYNCVNSVTCIDRPRINKIDHHDFYTCYCGRIIQNKWKTRYFHVQTSIHKFLVKEKHLELINKNLKYEVIIESDP